MVVQAARGFTVGTSHGTKPKCSTGNVVLTAGIVIVKPSSGIENRDCLRTRPRARTDLEVLELRRAKIMATLKGLLSKRCVCIPVRCPEQLNNYMFAGMYPALSDVNVVV